MNGNSNGDKPLFGSVAGYMKAHPTEGMFDPHFFKGIWGSMSGQIYKKKKGNKK